MILIILPVKNEKQSITKTVSDLFIWCRNNLKNCEILFIDDGSTDGTMEKIKKMKIKNVNVIKNRFEPGKGSALKVGYYASTFTYKMKEDDLIIFMDGDGQVSPCEISTFLNIMDFYNADVIIGNKKHLYSSTYYSFKRKVVSFIYNQILKLLFGIRFDDTQAGIKIFKKSVLDKVIDKITIKRFAFDVELIIAMRELGVRIADAPVNIKQQLNSGSVNLKNIVLTFIDTLRIYNKMMKGFYKNG